MIAQKKRQKIEYSQAFNELWLEDDQLKDWISKSDDPYKTLCKYCKVTFNQPKIDNLLRHRATKHLASISWPNNSGVAYTAMHEVIVKA